MTSNANADQHSCSTMRRELLPIARGNRYYATCVRPSDSADENYMNLEMKTLNIYIHTNINITSNRTINQHLQTSTTLYTVAVTSAGPPSPSEACGRDCKETCQALTPSLSLYVRGACAPAATNCDTTCLQMASPLL